jgi:hypothetical protein
MNMRVTMTLAIAAAVAMLFLADSASAQRNRRAPPNSYGAPNTSFPSSARDTRSAEDQRIIDAISRNGWSTGY